MTRGGGVPGANCTTTVPGPGLRTGQSPCMMWGCIESLLMDVVVLHRLHFAFTITYHYLFPQLTMGLALLIVVLKTLALRTGERVYNRAARFWTNIFGINFALGVVTGIPMEFQFGTNWADSPPPAA